MAILSNLTNADDPLCLWHTLAAIESHQAGLSALLLKQAYRKALRGFSCLVFHYAYKTESSIFQFQHNDFHDPSS